MKKKGKKKNGNKIAKIPVFYLIYLTVTAAVIFAIVLSMQLVRSRLAEYEAAQPRYVAAEVFAQYFQPIDYNSLLADSNYEAGEAGTDELIEYLKNEIGDSRLTYAVGSSDDENEVKYIVKAGQKQLAAIVLNTAAAKTKHGYDTYEYSHMDLYLNTDEYLKELSSYTVEAPSSYVVEMDGSALSKELVTSTYLQEDILQYCPSDVPGIEYSVYTITGIDKAPGEVKVTAPDGTAAEVSFDDETNTYTSGLAYSEQLSAEYTEPVTKAIEGYAAYIQTAENISLNSIKGYYDTSSKVYSEIVAMSGDRWMVNAEGGIDFEDVQVGEFYAHTPEIFSCHISFTQHIHSAGSEDYVDAVDKYVFLHLVNGEYKIYYWYNA